MDPPDEGLIIKPEELTCIDFVDKYRLADCEHQWILERLVIAFRYGKDQADSASEFSCNCCTDCVGGNAVH